MAGIKIFGSQLTTQPLFDQRRRHYREGDHFYLHSALLAFSAAIGLSWLDMEFC